MSSSLVNSWVKLRGIQDLDETTHRHLTAGFWALVMIFFGYFVIKMDTRHSTRSWIAVRDRIIGLEQRYFLVFLNGILLYATLVHMLRNSPAHAS